MNLQNQVAVVTGGAVRVGRALSLALAAEGLKTVVHFGRSADEAEEVAAEIRNANGQAAIVQADLQQPAFASKTIFEFARQTFGPVQVLINSAAIFDEDGFPETTEAAFDRQFAINLKAAYFLSQEFAKNLPADLPGQIVNIVDWRALRPGGDHLVYTMSKAAIATLTRSLAQKLAPRVRVNGVAPGAILPPSGAGDEYLQRLSEKIPLQRAGDPQFVADALRFLLRSDFITGEILHVTGGEQL